MVRDGDKFFKRMTFLVEQQRTTKNGFYHQEQIMPDSYVANHELQAPRIDRNLCSLKTRSRTQKQ